MGIGYPAFGPGPRRLAAGAAACLAVLLLFSSCAWFRTAAAPPRSSDVVVLLPDDEGKTGAITVSGRGGSELILSEPRQAVAVAPGSGAGEPYTLPQAEVRALVGPALAALPPRPMRILFHFERDDTTLTPESLAEMRTVMLTVADRGPVEVSVVGHTDTLGTRSYNHQLGLERARTVAGLLVKAGIDPTILEISSHGENNLLVPTGDEVPEPRNRRVELTVR